MTSLIEVMVERRMLITTSEDDTHHVSLKEGFADLIANHPVASTVAAGYLLNKAIKSARGNATIDVVTNTFKFYASTATERKIQQELVKLMIDSKHYSLLKQGTENGMTTWTLRRLAR